MTPTTSAHAGTPVERVATARARIEAACERVGRRASSVVIIGVGKTHGPEAVQAIVDAGVPDIGENRVDELRAKQGRVSGAHWHLVGRLQRNKARDVVGHHVLVHSLDRRSLADVLSRRAQDADVVQRALVQVNVGEDPAKGGCEADEALELVAYARELPHLSVEGLMTIPPLPGPSDDANDAAQPHFAALRRLRDEARGRWPEVVHLSMGMTADVEAAVSEGATMVRLGTALFGPRGSGPWRPAGGNR